MTVAFPVWDNMISPVMDTAVNLRIVTFENGGCVSDRTVSLPRNIHDMAACIAEQADTLICGAVSCYLEQEILARGVKVHPWVMGSCDTILNSLENGTIEQHEYSMPGCGRRGRRRCGRGNRNNRYGKG